MRTNWAAGAVTVSGIAAVLLFGGIRVSGQEAAPADPQSAMQEIDRKIEELQQKKDALQRQAEQQEVLADLQNQARERNDEITNELNDIRNAEETSSAAEKAQRQARIQHLETQTKAIADVLAVKDAEGLAKVQEIFVQMADRDTEWEVVTGPRLQAAAMLEELEAQANSDEGTQAQRKLLERIRVLCKENGAVREAQVKAARATAANTREIEKLIEQFHSGK